MFKKLALTVALTIVLTSVGCVCQSGNPFGIGSYYSCGPCAPSSFDCTPCGMSACDPVACGPCEQSCEPCGMTACEPAACDPCGYSPSACEVAACDPCGYAPSACENACGCNGGRMGMRTGFGLGLGSGNGLFSSFGYTGKSVKQGHGAFGRPYQEDMYVTRGPRDYFYAPPMR